MGTVVYLGPVLQDKVLQGVFMITSEHYGMWLYMLEGVGERRAQRLLEAFGSAQGVFEADIRELARIEGLGAGVVRRIQDSRDPSLLEGYAQWLRDNEAAFVSLEDASYPRLLREVPNPPYGFFVKGRMPDDTLPRVAIVGSRRCTDYGRREAYEMARELSNHGVVVVSGLAKGIDAHAHSGALEGGRTIGVLGCGVDVVYPAENRNLFSKVEEGGCIVSIFPPGAAPLPAYFPARNRIISGLSDAVVVVEAAIKSGTLITVGHALDQGREVFAVPGSVRSKLSGGTNMLIMEGAAVATSAADILRYLGVSPVQKAIKPAISSATPDEAVILELLENEQTVDFQHILQQTGLDTHAANQALTMMEIRGLVRKLPGLRYVGT